MLLFILPPRVSCAQSRSESPGSVDAVTTVVGRDDSVIAVPPPWKQGEMTVPDVVAQDLAPIFLPPISPPQFAWPQELPAPLPADENRASPS
jgi:hypothetical protein